MVSDGDVDFLPVPGQNVTAILTAFSHAWLDETEKFFQTRAKYCSPEAILEMRKKLKVWCELRSSKQFQQPMRIFREPLLSVPKVLMAVRMPKRTIVAGKSVDHVTVVIGRQDRWFGGLGFLVALHGPPALEFSQVTANMDRPVERQSLHDSTAHSTEYGQVLSSLGSFQSVFP